MGELALRKIQAGPETTRGTAVPATRPIYGMMTISRKQDRRFAVEQRGTFVKYQRANPKLVEAGFKLEADLTFEDFPYFLETVLQGGVAPTGTAGTGYVWTYNPDLSSDLIKTRTYYAGDDTVQWRGAFGASDKLDIAMSLDDAVKMELEGFIQDWVPVSSGFLTTPFTGGFQGGLADRTVESIMGYQSLLFIDAVGGTIGTTRRVGRFISQKTGIHLNNKPKFFGDNVAYMQKLGRGLKDVSCEFVFEGMDTSEFAPHYNNIEQLIRIQMLGSAIAGTTFGTTNGALTAGSSISAITTNALTAAIPGGVGISVGGQVFSVTPAGAAAGATSIPIVQATVTNTIASGATVMAAKTINIDLWGFWDSFAIGARDTNTTFGMKLVGVNDSGVGFDHRVTVQNGNNQAAGVS